MKIDQFVEKTIDYWQGYLEWTDELPDGARQAAIEESFYSGKSGCLECCEMSPVDWPKADGNDFFHAYVAKVSDE